VKAPSPGGSIARARVREWRFQSDLQMLAERKKIFEQERFPKKRTYADDSCSLFVAGCVGRRKNHDRDLEERNIHSVSDKNR
jgi:hypothetical protein